MTNRWESLAREDAEFYIWTDLAKGDDFFASGERDVQRILGYARPFIRATDAALEIGCGVGRLTIPMSREFDRVVAIDIAPTMLTKLAANCAARDIEHITPMLAGDAWQSVTPIDFAYSRIVLQHIEEWSTIVDYFQRVAACLAAHGAFYVQFDTRPTDVAYYIKNQLPDVVLPRNFRRGVRRIRRTVDDIETLARACGLHTETMRGAGTEDTEFVFTKRAS
jgi:cyclopropane fatty-acyl-phospholipid synthase-like methyltransferase